MKTPVIFAFAFLFVFRALAVDSAARITPEIRAALDQQKQRLVEMASEPVLVAAVREQNARGPQPELSNRVWAR